MYTHSIWYVEAVHKIVQQKQNLPFTEATFLES